MWLVLSDRDGGGFGNLSICSEFDIFLKKIWNFLAFKALPGNDMAFPGFLFLPFNSGSPGEI
jgi:hypothetical protein